MNQKSAVLWKNFNNLISSSYVDTFYYLSMIDQTIFICLNTFFLQNKVF